MSERVVDVVAEHADVLAPVFHIPAQSGDDYVLSLMGRGYDRKKYLAIIDRIRAKLPDATITSDFIVGCPGESEDAFQRTLTLTERVGFDNAMTAAYSPRPGTPMARWDGASDAFELLFRDDKDQKEKKRAPVDLLRGALRSRRTLGAAPPPQEQEDSGSSSSSIEGLRSLVNEAFRAKLWHVSGDDLKDLVAARKTARAALDAAAKDPLFVFDPLAQIGPSQISEDVKERRLRELNDLQRKVAYDRAQRFLGRTEEVLVEAINPKRPAQVCGRTRHNKLVFFDGGLDLVGHFVDVKITNASAFSLSGTRVVTPE
mmetsp:Transcript_22907/g.73645  ORF Transcript_22907/g.73645 Transcript_22907/m.73645 type:complete len:315 (+) Transcript_22907:1398-2342(+)